MKRYLLDSNTVSYLHDSKSPFCQAVKKRAENISDQDEISISILTVYEHCYGIAKATDYNDTDLINKVKNTYSMMLDSFTIISLSVEGAEEFGKLKNEYRIDQKKDLQKKLKVDTVDLMMAGTAIAKNAIFVSNDKIFGEIKKMRPDFLLEDWTK
ncbi:MAG: type II toxin-antitoxin system VapC family toxin [Deltaproteobacteria bacterium]|nr:type II toxin-antitoxin system VapC family toxin [Deltaproteobacteria bacterium]